MRGILRIGAGGPDDGNDVDAGSTRAGRRRCGGVHGAGFRQDPGGGLRRSGRRMDSGRQGGARAVRRGLRQDAGRMRRRDRQVLGGHIHPQPRRDSGPGHPHRRLRPHHRPHGRAQGQVPAARHPEGADEHHERVHVPGDRVLLGLHRPERPIGDMRRGRPRVHRGFREGGVTGARAVQARPQGVPAELHPVLPDPRREDRQRRREDRPGNARDPVRLLGGQVHIQVLGRNHGGVQHERPANCHRVARLQGRRQGSRHAAGLLRGDACTS